MDFSMTQKQRAGLHGIKSFDAFDGKFLGADNCRTLRANQKNSIGFQKKVSLSFRSVNLTSP